MDLGERTPRLVMRSVVLITAAFLGGGFILLGVLILVMGEALVPARHLYVQAFGVPAYAMGIGWLGLGTCLFCIGLLGAEVGPRYYVRKCRDAAFLVFGAGFAVAVLLVILRVYAN